jgi:hypothetical protein
MPIYFDENMNLQSKKLTLNDRESGVDSFYQRNIKLFPNPRPLYENPRPEDITWNSRKKEFNCYAYAVSGIEKNPDLNLPSVPGTIGGGGLQNNDIINSLIKDGLKKLENSPGSIPQPEQGHYLIALVVDNRSGKGFNQAGSLTQKSDFHFYRLDTDGTWSHKANNCNVSRIDASGQTILNPEFADRDYRKILINGIQFNINYNEFIGYFQVPNKGLEKIHKNTLLPDGVKPIKGYFVNATLGKKNLSPDIHCL